MRKMKNEGWRQLSVNETEVIHRITMAVASQFTYEPQIYLGKLIDDFGSLALSRRGES